MYHFNPFNFKYVFKFLVFRILRNILIQFPDIFIFKVHLLNISLKHNILNSFYSFVY